MALVKAVSKLVENDENEDENIAAHTFAAIILFAYQVNRDFAKGTLSEAVAMTEPIAVIMDEAIRQSLKDQPSSEQAVS